MIGIVAFVAISTFFAPISTVYAFGGVNQISPPTLQLTGYAWLNPYPQALNLNDPFSALVSILGSFGLQPLQTVTTTVTQTDHSDTATVSTVTVFTDTTTASTATVTDTETTSLAEITFVSTASLTATSTATASATVTNTATESATLTDTSTTTAVVTNTSTAYVTLTQTVTGTTATTSSLTTTATTSSSTTSATTITASSVQLNVNLYLQTYKTVNPTVEVCTDSACSNVVAEVVVGMGPSQRQGTAVFVLALPPDTYYVQVSDPTITTQLKTVTFGSPSPQTVTFIIF